MQTVQRAASNYSTIREMAAGMQQTKEVDHNRLEALKVLSHSLLSEIEALNHDKNRSARVKINLADEVQNYEASLIRCALMRTGGNQRRAARLLSIKVTTLNAKIKRYGISPSGLSPDEKEKTAKI
jgi:DNA-binding NtrC family response regulator